MVNGLPTREDIIKVDEFVWEISKSFRSDMLVPVRFYAHENMLDNILMDRALWQLINVATLPGIQKYAFAMPDIHQGYGFPIGGVAASAIEEGGVISPGGIGYDINCGVRLLVADMMGSELKPYMKKLGAQLFNRVPSGVGKGGKIKMEPDELDKVLMNGAAYMVKKGYGTQEDLIFCEEEGAMSSADASLISDRAKKRGRDQIGTLGSGNHFLEVQVVDEIYDQDIADTFGLTKGFVTVMIHCGSRGFGHQTCTDYLKIMNNKLAEWGYVLPDRELIYAPMDSLEGKQYFGAMAAAANYAWANRHVIGHWVREAWEHVIGPSVELKTVYDVSHNIGKIETHMINGKEKKVIMHRKGATRAFGPGRPEVPDAYKAVGQPVLIPGTMGTASYVLSGTAESMDVAFGSTCHGAGRKMSRSKAKHLVRGSELRKELERKGIVICSDSDRGLAEEAPMAYKDIDEVIAAVSGAKLAKKVARLKPLIVVKGG